jgi:hypothetical protein
LKNRRSSSPPRLDFFGGAGAVTAARAFLNRVLIPPGLSVCCAIRLVGGCGAAVLSHSGSWLWPS